MKSYMLVVGLVLCLVARAQTPTQQAELEKATKAAQAELDKLKDPVYINRLFDEQVRELKTSGAATPELLRELEKARTEMLNLAREGKITRDASVADSTAPADTLPTDPLAPQLTNTQPDVYDEKPSPYGKHPSFFKFYRETKVSATEFPAFFQKQYGLEIQPVGEPIATHGGSLQRYHQIHQGQPITNAVYKLFLNPQGQPLYATGILYDARYLSSLMPVARIKKAVEKYYAQQNLRVQEQTGEPADRNRSSVPWYRLLGLYAYAPHRSSPRLTYQVYGSANSHYLYFDAATAALVASESALKTCRPNAGPDSAVVVRTQQYGEVTVKTNSDMGYHWLIDTSVRPRLVNNDRTMSNFELWKKRDFDLDQMPASDSTVRVISANDWNDATLQIYKSGHYDARYGMVRALEFYQTYMGLVAPDPSIKTLSISRFGEFVDELSFGKQINAFWNKAENEIAFMGDRLHKSLVDMDVLGHELTHGVVDYTADLDTWGESGALNEAISDMMGESMEQEYGRGDWLIGARTFTGGLRNMQAPKLLNQRPDTYEGQYWQDPALCTTESPDRCYIHVNQGVANRWFYLLVNGGKGENDLKKKYEVKTGIGHRKAAQLVYQTLLKLHAKSDYEDFCEKSILTAGEMFGACSEGTLAVKNAWYAVGVLDDAPARCKGYTFDLVSDTPTSQTIRFYVRGDSIVSVFRDEDGWTKSFSEKSSAYINYVTLNADGHNSVRVAKNWAGTLLSKMNEMLPMQQEETAKALAAAKAEMNDPTTSPERRAELRQSIPMVEKQLEAGQKQAGQMRENLLTLSDGSMLSTERGFWGDRKTRRDFDKKYIKGSQVYEGRYLANKYVIPIGGQNMTWLSTTQIPLRYSDLGLFVPVGSARLRPGVDHFLRGFPLKMFGGLTIKNIKETIPRNFDALFSTGTVFQ